MLLTPDLLRSTPGWPSIPSCFGPPKYTPNIEQPRNFIRKNNKIYLSGSATSSSTVSQKREENGEEWLTGSTIPTTLERTLAPGIALLIVTSLLLVCSYLLLLFLA